MTEIRPFTAVGTVRIGTGTYTDEEMTGCEIGRKSK